MVGDGAVKKTNMVLAYRSSEYGSFCYPSVLDNFTKQLSVDGTEVELSVWDLYGQPEATRLQLFVAQMWTSSLLCFLWRFTGKII